VNIYITEKVSRIFKKIEKKLITEIIFHLLLAKRFPEINLQSEKYSSSAFHPSPPIIYTINAPNNPPIYKRNTHSPPIFFKSKLNHIPQLSKSPIFTSSLRTPTFSAAPPIFKLLCTPISTVAPPMPYSFCFH